MLIEDLENTSIKSVIETILKQWPLKIPKYMYHVTKKENLKSIKKDGLLVSKYGDVHGEMEIKPPSPAIYLSTSPNSNNLNTNLSGHELVSLKIDTSYIDIKNIYIDDGFYVAYGNEQVFYEPDDTAYDLNISEDDAEILLDYMETLSNNNIMLKTRFLLGWYLKNHGEISVTQNIPPESIVDIFYVKNPFT